MNSVDDFSIVPGCRVLVFDSRLFKDDVSTPLSMTMKPATVVCRYGMKHHYKFDGGGCWTYPDLVDVEFDHRPGEVSKGHFTSGVEKI